MLASLAQARRWELKTISARGVVVDRIVDLMRQPQTTRDAGRSGGKAAAVETRQGFFMSAACFVAAGSPGPAQDARNSRTRRAILSLPIFPIWGDSAARRHWSTKRGRSSVKSTSRASPAKR